MGTSINGNVWSGACVNGKVVSGLVKNGVVFYKKEIQELYKRRIMVGDNLTGKTLYADFDISDFDYIAVDGDNDVVNMVGSPNYRIIESKITYTTPHKKEVRLQYYNPEAFLHITSVPFVIMTPENETTKNNSITIITDENDRSVTAVDENYTYRKIFIEDPNIRPVQVGDVITRNTKFYFTIPDDIFSRSNIGINPIRIGRDSSLSVLDNGNIIQFYINNMVSSDNEVVIFENGELVKNKSSMIVAETYGSYFEGTVTSVESDSLVYNMTFVDVRTLGA